MRYGSVDAAIAENLLSKGNPFCPILNPEMEVNFIDLQTAQVTENASQSSKI